MKDVYWLSFVEDKKCLGCAVVEAESPIDAVREAHRLAINPGGEVGMVTVPRESFSHCIGKFYTVEQIREIWPEAFEPNRDLN